MCHEFKKSVNPGPAHSANLNQFLFTTPTSRIPQITFIVTIPRKSTKKATGWTGGSKKQ